MSKLETETFAGKTMQAWKDQATKAGLVLRAPVDLDSGDYPDRIYSSLRHFRRNIAITKDHIFMSQRYFLHLEMIIIYKIVINTERLIL